MITPPLFTASSWPTPPASVASSMSLNRKMATNNPSNTAPAFGCSQSAPYFSGMAQSFGVSPTPLFGRTLPTAADVNGIEKALNGWEDNPRILGPSYYASPEIEAALNKWVHAYFPGEMMSMPNVVQMLRYPLKEQVPEHIIRTLANGKQRIAKFLHLRQPDILAFADTDAKEEAIDFLTELKKELADSNKQMKKALHFTKAEINLFNQFAIKTAPVLFYLGFEDAIPHAAQVSRLAAFKAKAQNAPKHEILQAAMVGWLHDPKLPSKLSKSNLATHPVIGSAIGRHVLRELQQPLENYLQSLPDKPAAPTVDQFIRGTMEALSINNDSRFVVDNFIVRGAFGDEPGLADQIEANETKGKALAVELVQKTDERLAAPSQGQNVRSIQYSKPLLAALSGTSLDTGHFGINRTAWNKACGQVAPSHDPDTLFENLIHGDLTDRELLRDISKALQGDKTAFQDVRVSGKALLSHHGEVNRWGKTAALALVNSDPLLLSAHKVVAVSKGSTFLQGLKSFVASFDININDLPAVYNFPEAGKQWQGAVYWSILQAADRLNDTHLADSIPVFLDTVPIDDVIADLRQKITAPETWGEVGRSKFSSSHFNIAVRNLEETYTQMLPVYREFITQKNP